MGQFEMREGRWASCTAHLFLGGDFLLLCVYRLADLIRLKVNYKTN